MLRLLAEQVESLWDEVLPVEVRELPEDLARLDRGLLIRRYWRRSLSRGRSARAVEVAPRSRLRASCG